MVQKNTYPKWKCTGRMRCICVCICMYRCYICVYFYACMYICVFFNACM